MTLLEDLQGGSAKIVRKFLRNFGEGEDLLLVWVVVLCASAAAMTAAFVATGFGIGSPTALVALAVLAIIAERESIRVSPVTEISIASLIFLFAGVVLGPLAATIVGACGLLVDLRRRDVPRPYLRWAAWTSSRMLVAGSAGLAAWAIVSSGNRDAFPVILAAVAVASLIDVFVDLALGSITTMVRGTSSFSDFGRSLGPLLVASVPLHVPVIAVLAYAYERISPWSALLFVAPAFAAQRLFLLYRQQRETSDALGVANDRLERANLSFATALVATLDARDRYTAGHSAAVAIYARDIADRMGLPRDVQQRAHLAGLVHDIGKVGLAAGLLEKTGPLSLDERRQMEQHSPIGARILANVDDYADIAAVVRHHHERVDGHGYPDRLSAEQIPVLSRIIAVADAYNAMTSDRPYRDAMPSRVARLRLAQAVETQFDTSVVAAFEAILAGATEDYRLASRDDFVLQRAELADEPDVSVRLSVASF